MNRCGNLGERREKNDPSSAGKKLWKSRAKSALGNRFAIPTFPQLRRRPHLSLDDRDHFLQNPPASVASLRRLITSLRNADHDQPGIPITFAGIPSPDLSTMENATILVNRGLGFGCAGDRSVGLTAAECNKIGILLTLECHAERLRRGRRRVTVRRVHVGQRRIEGAMP